MAEIGIETHQTSRNSDLRGVSCLLLSLFCELRHSNVFFKNILIVKIYKKYIFNNFLIVESRRTCALLFQKLPSPTLAPES